MATKYELAGYLANLHTLLEAQSKGQHSVPSTTLAAEYERIWGQFKQEIESDEKRRRTTA